VGDAGECIGDNRRLQLELPWIGNVRIQAAAALKIDGLQPSIRRGLVDRAHRGVANALAQALESPLARARPESPLRRARRGH
jgi:hypothetical protein